ncbi:L,D-transpeptidase family protein [Wenxinia saemankumensis]|uniref:Murein L,D-transpeptidase YcbB/YkuD n=1 Tax=Wenxinia saemankumensis TaxID=1447782 RepID=A0A1M6HDA9_9RHOB|nr:L,D-transpeptidase family protein [Wenxinia saemankumensis]SHJ20124.1 Murein L,D-transpeptidase YcbB/YkuD [Wenxinia saemankumensis]
MPIRPRSLLAAALASFLVGMVPPAATAQQPTQVLASIDPFRVAVAESAARDEDLAAFYRGRGFAPVWSGSEPVAVARRNALMTALTQAPTHGLPAARFDPAALVTRLRAARGPAELGRMEVELSRAYLDYARAVQSGILTPREVVPLIRREVPYADRQELLEDFIAAEAPLDFIRGLAPRNPEYVRLMRAKMQLEADLRTGGWGAAVPSAGLRLGSSGPAVVALRDRLTAMGWLGRTRTATYDAQIEAAVRAFQDSVGIEPDGVVGEGTRAALNVPPEERLQSVLVAMERERWMNFERGDRHIWVNLTDFHAQVVDHDRVTFETRSVIGAGSADRQTPEFSDVMEYMEINPYWYVPASIIRGEYGGRVPGGFQAVNNRGQVVGVSNVMVNGRVNYSLRQPPGPNNALGRVKFMFPNQYNIYLHDTPSRSLFAREVRTFSHGCIRLNDPLDFAYHLLERQEDDPVGFFDARLNSGANTRVDLVEPLPVHLVYRTAFTDTEGRLHFRNDVYGRDARLWSALAAEGVALGGLSG